MREILGGFAKVSTNDTWGTEGFNLVIDRNLNLTETETNLNFGLP